MPDIVVRLFSSRKFVTALGALVAAIIISFVPQLTPVREEMIFMIGLVVSVFIGGTALEDAARTSREDSRADVDENPESIEDETSDLLDAVISELETNLQRRGINGDVVKAETQAIRQKYSV